MTGKYVLSHISLSSPTYLPQVDSSPVDSQAYMRGSTQRKALATRSVVKNLELIFSILTPQYWCQNDRTDEGFQMVHHLTTSDTIMMELTRT